MRIKILILILIAGVISLTKSTTVNACPIPVFRYALEFWDADPYSIEIFYESSFEPGEEELVNYLLSASRGGEIKANLELRNLDVKGNIDDISRGYLNNISPPEFPWVVMRYPRVSGINEVIWSGPLDKENVDLMVNSPAREDIAGKLAGDVTAVWIFLESGNRRKDRDALDLLNKQLRRLEQTLALPDLELWWNSSREEIDEKIPSVNFEVVTISRNDPHELYLVKMLMNSERDLYKFESEPMVFPVYGRGVALWAIVGSGVNEWNIREAAEFLTGPCSCQAKLLNPGVDLLMAMDWDNVVENISDASLANPLSGMGDFSSRGVEVKRRLELATDERMGIAANEKTDDRLDTDAGRVVYLDVFVDAGHADLDSEAEPSEIEGAGTEAGAYERTESRAGRETTPGATADTRSETVGSSGLDYDAALPAGSRYEETTGERRGGETVPAYSGVTDGQGPGVVRNQPDKKMDFINIVALVFGGVISFILLGGLILYWKNIK